LLLLNKNLKHINHVQLPFYIWLTVHLVTNS